MLQVRVAVRSWRFKSSHPHFLKHEACEPYRRLATTVIRSHGTETRDRKGAEALASAGFGGIQPSRSLGRDTLSGMDGTTYGPGEKEEREPSLGCQHGQ